MNIDKIYKATIVVGLLHSTFELGKMIWDIFKPDNEDNNSELQLIVDYCRLRGWELDMFISVNEDLEMDEMVFQVDGEKQVLIPINKVSFIHFIGALNASSV